MTKQEDIIEKMARLEENNKSTNQRIEELQKITKAFYDLASDVKVIANELVSMKQDICSIKSDIDEKNNEPNKMLFNVKNSVLTGVIMAIVSAIMVLILK